MINETWAHRWERRTEWPLAVAAVAFLVVYSVQVLARPHGAEEHDLDVASSVVWGLFVVDYLVRLILATDRREWFVRHWFDLLVVALPLMRPLRLLRLVVLVGALQRAIGGVVRGRILIYTVSGVVLLIYVGSLAIFDQEYRNPDAKITSFGDALWWAICTVTTVGYGDQYPVTVTGRIIAVLLMIGGISLIGVVTASLASWIVQMVAETDTANQTVTAAHIDDLRKQIQALSEALRNGVTPAEQPSSPG